MRLGEYFWGRPLVLHTRLSPEDAERKINEAALSILSPFAYGVVGWARMGAIRLRYRRGPFAYSGKPILAGGFAKDAKGTRLDLVYRAPWALRIFLPLWTVLFAVGFAFVFVGGELWTQGPAIAIPFLVVPILVVVAVPLVHAFAIRRADAELVLLVDFLREAVGATGAAEIEALRASA